MLDEIHDLVHWANALLASGGQMLTRVLTMLTMARGDGFVRKHGN